MDDTLRTCHPAVSFAYFALVIACAMLLMHPVCLVLSTLGGGWYVARLLGGKGLRRHLLWLLPMALLAAAVNPAFVHQGVTILAYLPSGNPLTLESLLYGLAAGTMLSAVALWFVCVTDVITSDKVVYLFGRVIPALSLLLSMILRFVPRFVRRLRAVAQAQRHLGRDTQTGAPVRRVRSALRVFSIVVTWSLESGLITADSMRCRGYGLPGRTSFSLYRFDRRDGAVALWLAFCGLYLLGGGLAAGELIHFLMEPVLDAEEGGHLRHAATDGGRVAAQALQSEGQLMPDLVGDGLLLRGLEDEADISGLLMGRQVIQRLTVEEDTALGRTVGAQGGLQLAEKRGLAAAGGAAEDPELALTDREGHIRQRGAGLLGIGEAKMLQTQQFRHGASLLSGRDSGAGTGRPAAPA